MFERLPPFYLLEWHECKQRTTQKQYHHWLYTLSELFCYCLLRSRFLRKVEKVHFSVKLLQIRLNYILWVIECVVGEERLEWSLVPERKNSMLTVVIQSAVEVGIGQLLHNWLSVYNSKYPFERGSEGEDSMK